MKVRVPDLTAEVREIDFSEPARSVNEWFSTRPELSDQKFGGDLTVRGEIYRTGTDVHFAGEVRGTLECSCCRCLAAFRRETSREFRFVIVKADGAREIRDDAGCDHYSGDEVDLGPLVCEQALLGLDSVARCSESCRGLCSGCGANLNSESCACQSD